ncbi:Regulatory protein RecX [bacterium HR29]|jgi:regulatory protein|nr:Regulatory protein RecX [bacterium HR29]
MDEPPSHRLIVVAVRPGGHRQQLIVLSDGRELLVHEEALASVGPVHEGDAISEDRIAELERANWRVVAHEAALRLLSHRARSERELRTRLELRGIPADIVAAEVERLRETGLLDDEKFAAAWVEERRRTSPRSRRMLRYELLGRGIDPDAVERATRDVDDLPTALELARQRGSRLEGAGEEAFIVNVGAFLRRRGFDWETARHAARLAWMELTSEEPPEETRNGQGNHSS